MRWKTCVLVGWVLGWVAACGGTQGKDAEAPQPPPPPCRVNTVAVPAVTKTLQNLPFCEASDYAQACDQAIGDLDAQCLANCNLYKKRRPPPTVGPVCQPYPLETTVEAFDAQKHCIAVMQGDTQKFTATCTVSGRCTCDP